MPSFIPITLAIAAVVLAVVSIVLTRRVEQRNPPMGAFAEIDGLRLHYVDIPAGPEADLAPMVFIHGAAGNARDLHGAFAEALKGRGRMIFVDRPGAGYSTRSGQGDSSPQAQARAIAGLIGQLETGPVVIVGHSFGSAVAAALVVHHPDKVAGIVFVAPASHPWPGNALTWYYNIAKLPVIGRAFAFLIAVPFGHLLYRRAVRSVFEPDRPPHDYAKRSSTGLVLRPSSFFHNASDVGALKANLEKLSPRYREIRVPVTIVTGDSDKVVSPEIHARGLERDIEGARLVWLEGRGHMPTYSATAEIVAELERLNGRIGRGAETGRKAQIPERPSLAT